MSFSQLANGTGRIFVGWGLLGLPIHVKYKVCFGVTSSQHWPILYLLAGNFVRTWNKLHAPHLPLPAWLDNYCNLDVCCRNHKSCQLLRSFILEAMGFYGLLCLKAITLKVSRFLVIPVPVWVSSLSQIILKVTWCFLLVFTGISRFNDGQ